MRHSPFFPRLFFIISTIFPKSLKLYSKCSECVAVFFLSNITLPFLKLLSQAPGLFYDSFKAVFLSTIISLEMAYDPRLPIETKGKKLYSLIEGEISLSSGGCELRSISLSAAVSDLLTIRELASGQNWHAKNGRVGR